MRKAKIVCTLGPATDYEGGILELVKAGMNVARINASHGSHPEHEGRIDLVRAAAEELKRPIAVLVDLQGPKIRLGRFIEGPHYLNIGDKFTITTRDVEGTKDICSTTFKGLAGDCNPGDILLIDDGKVAVRVLEVKDGTDVVTEVEVPGNVSNNKGINLPGVAVSIPALSKKDEEDLRWGLRYGADMIALSFVRNAKDIEDVHRIMDEEGVRRPVIAKIEKPQAVENLKEIVQSFDGIMVARGDLGVELPLEQVPIVQKRAISLCREFAKPVILATQVLESMIDNPRPTRAEASDCANAILDGADAVMLSGETSVGKFPIICVKTMANIVNYTETEGLGLIPPIHEPDVTLNRAISRSALEIAEAMNAREVVVYTETGHSARQMTRHRSRIPVIAFTPHKKVRNQLALLWGARSYLAEKTAKTTDQVVAQVDMKMREYGLGQDGDVVVIVAGMPMGIAGSTNTIRVHTIGEEVG
ncbi:pyruvate kinase [Actinotignum urinale]|uniref:Pyruvate kinase n=1 Tax=Actinotignum urinale TaxID=190146 RepID=A0ABU5G7K7_9ACTO|nr:pyruvate kinase [Actinotignum urinale]MDY5128879.1 pyruvate kinase [Actinotignum urinale]MDY5133093.1 pyruvate kinase [Actinotignum urinale]